MYFVRSKSLRALYRGPLNNKKRDKMKPDNRVLPELRPMLDSLPPLPYWRVIGEVRIAGIC